MVPQNIMPKISVCIPNYNGAKFLRQAVESVLSQEYHDYELVIVDNCSDDDSEELINNLMKECNGVIRSYRNERNIGMAGNLNKCLEYARGAYIKFLCADDLLLPGCLEQMANKLDMNKSAVLVTSARQLVDEHGKQLAIERYAGRDLIVPGSQVIIRCLYGRNYIGEPSAVMFRKDVDAGVFRVDMSQLLDLDMWFQLLEHGNLLYINEPLCAIRRHESQMSHTNLKAGLVVENHVKLYDVYSHKSYLKPTLLQIIQFKFFMSYRVWMSQKYISDEYKRVVLGKYANKFMYKLMPIAHFGLDSWRRFSCFRRKLLSSRKCV